MTEGRRHSVDVPISRALVALRRVKSLRDPSTNSMSKFAALFDNLDAEDGLSIGDSAHFVDGYPEFGPGNPPKSLGDQLRDSACNSSMFTDCRNPAFAETTCKDLSLIGEAFTPLSGSDEAEESKFQYDGRCRAYEMYNKSDTPASNHVEDADSCSEPSQDPMRDLGANSRVFHWRDQYESNLQSSLNRGDVASRIGGMSSYMKDELSDVDCDFQGCGLSYCWSRTPRLKSDPPSDVDDQPLLSGEIGDAALLVQNGNWKLNNTELIPFEGSPRNLSQKFRPKMFKELVGQNVIIRSLSLAISSRRPSSLYLFHGPRGTGKTTVSRIFAAALNCVSQGEHKPCGSCYYCCSFFSGHSKDIIYVDSVAISERNRIGHLMNRAVSPPKSSAFKVIVFDECQLLRKDAWAALLNSLNSVPQHVVLIMITPDLEKLPHSVVSQSQRFRFQKIKDPEISARLKKLCIAEGFEFEQAALDFIAAKSGGSLRDAEMMLEQLSLSGKTISRSLAYEVTGTISDDELLELLEVALSSDTSNTVRMAREMMKSRIDPMQLATQLANLIMDILAGKSQEDSSEVRKIFFENHSSEADLQMLSHALKILSETEKQLRVSKNQSTWLTAALLQFSSLEANMDPVDSKVPITAVGLIHGESRSTPSTVESLRPIAPCVCDDKSSDKLKVSERLETIWTSAIEMCQSSSLRRFLRKHGRLSSVCASRGVVVAQLDFLHGKHVTRAENAWKLIASSLQNTLGCNVEIQINLVSGSHAMKGRKLFKGCLNFLNCGRRSHQKSYSTTVQSSGQSVSSDLTSEKAMIGDKTIESCGSISGQQAPHSHCYGTTTTIRDSQGNVLRTEWLEPVEALFDDVPIADPVKQNKTTEYDGTHHAVDYSKGLEVEFLPKCLDKGADIEDKLGMSRKSQQSDFVDNKPREPVYKKASFLACGMDAAFISRNSNKLGEHDNVEGSRKKSKLHCWKTPSRLKKAWHLNQGQNRKQSMWVLPCTSDK